MASPKPRRAPKFKMPDIVDPVLRAFLRQGDRHNVAMFYGNEKGPTYVSDVDPSGQVAEVYVISAMQVADDGRYLVALYLPNWHPTRSEFAVAEYLQGCLVELWEARAEDNTVLLPATEHYKKIVAIMGVGPARQGGCAECDWYCLSRLYLPTEVLRVKAQR